MKTNTSKIKIYPQVITPEMATKYLEKNLGLNTGDKIKNRIYKENNVNFLYNQMKKGEWMVTGNPIKFSDKGRLIDGQHTLRAIIKHGKPVEIFVAEGLDESVFSVLDTGKNRTASDVLSMMGYANSTVLAGASRSILLFQAGSYSIESGTRGRVSHTTNQDILKFVAKNNEIHEVLSFVSSIYRKFRFISTSQLSALYWELSKNNQSKCDAFFEKYSTGVDLSETSPIRLLREKLLKDSTNKHKLRARDKMALFIMAWNAYITNKKIFSLSLPKNYEFPKPI
jgi:hypothetical protein